MPLGHHISSSTCFALSLLYSELSSMNILTYSYALEHGHYFHQLVCSLSRQHKLKSMKVTIMSSEVMGSRMLVTSTTSSKEKKKPLQRQPTSKEIYFNRHQNSSKIKWRTRISSKKPQNTRIDMKQAQHYRHPARHTHRPTTKSLEPGPNPRLVKQQQRSHSKKRIMTHKETNNAHNNQPQQQVNAEQSEDQQDYQQDIDTIKRTNKNETQKVNDKKHW